MVAWTEFIMGIIFGIAVSAILPQIPQTIKKIFENAGKELGRQKNNTIDSYSGEHLQGKNYIG